MRQRSRVSGESGDKVLNFCTCLKEQEENHTVTFGYNFVIQYMIISGIYLKTWVIYFVNIY